MLKSAHSWARIQFAYFAGGDVRKFTLLHFLNVACRFVGYYAPGLLVFLFHCCSFLQGWCHAKRIRCINPNIVVAVARKEALALSLYDIEMAMDENIPPPERVLRSLNLARSLACLLLGTIVLLFQFSPHSPPSSSPVSDTDF